MSFAPKLVSAEVPGLYQDPSGFWVRIRIDGKRAWRKLAALTFKKAVQEADSKVDAHKAFLAGVTKSSPFCEGENTFKHIAALYLSAGCPHSRTKTSRNPHFCSGERARIDWLNKYFGDKSPDEITLPLLTKHADWRKQFCKRGGARVIELEWCTLSNVLSFAVFHELATFNHIRQQRPQLRDDDPGNTTAARIRHSREVSAPSGDMVHQLANELFKDERAESTAFLWLFANLTGLRLAELLALRMDARPPLQADGLGEPGYTDDRFLHAKRGKRSKLHKVLLYPELSDLLNAHFRWHQTRYPDNPFYFPGMFDKMPLARDSAGDRIDKVCTRMKWPHLTIHGARSFFATVLRSQRLGDAEIASRIGDSTVELVQEVYGGQPGNWQGGEALSFLPKDGKPAWSKWSVELTDSKTESTLTVQ